MDKNTSRKTGKFKIKFRITADSVDNHRFTAALRRRKKAFQIFPLDTQIRSAQTVKSDFPQCSCSR